jgi:hypothetical protein
MLSLTLLASCGSDSGGGSSSNTVPQLQEQTVEGSYRAILRPYNNSLSGFLPTGAAEVKVSGEEVSVKTYLDDDAKVRHLQSIHTGTRCPNASDDTNGDGFVDVEESMAVVGSVLIPLDADLNNAVAGEAVYPAGSGFTYSEQASLQQLEDDVQARLNQNLNFEGRVVLIHGAAPITQIPATVRTMNALPVQASIPIVCGILKRL